MEMPGSKVDRWLLRSLRKLSGPAPVRFALAGCAEQGEIAESLPTIRFADRKTLLSLLISPEITFGDAYSEGKIEIDVPLLDVLIPLYSYTPGVGNWYSRLISRWMAFVQANDPRGSRHNIHHHYDISNDFYRKWLDADLVYTCAYFPYEGATLEEAQRAKFDLVCRKLWLSPGETVVEAGCGWGTLALYMARNFGVKVKAFNISHEQIVFARESARLQGLEGLVEFVEDDYRNITGHYDAFVSVGMLEHVGRKQYSELGRVIARSVGRSGRGLLHFIGRNRPQPLSVWIRRRIFPGAYPPTLREAMEVLEPHDYSVLDVENLRMHYAKTIEHWLSRYEEHFQEIEAQFGPRFARAWRLYLAGSIAAFRIGTLQLFQVVFAGRECHSTPWTRAHLYAGAPRRPSQDDRWTSATY